MKNNCKDCLEYKRCKESFISLVFFIIGVIATIAVRVVAIVSYLKPIYGQIAWYIGVTGFLIFFIYKYKVDNNRYKTIEKNNLMKKILNGEDITSEDRVVIGSILCALKSNKDRINYFLIFFTSAIALIIALYFDFFKK